MKTAYSLFLHEYVDPAKIDYTDCKTFQVVCAVCKEPVFKVARENRGKQSHYFSHYRKDETLNSQCELRARSISKSRMEEIQKESRNQKLSLFLQVFQDMVWQAEYSRDGKWKAQQYFFGISKSKTLSKLFTGIWGNLQGESKEDVLDMFDESLENIDDPASGYTSDYALNLRKEFAFDFFQHLLAGHAKANYFFLLKHAFIKVLESLEKKHREEGLLPWEEKMFDSMRRILKTNNDKKRMEILNKMGEYQMTSPYTYQEVDLFVIFGSYLQYHAFGILLRIPYFQLLKTGCITPHSAQSVPSRPPCSSR